MTKINIMKKPGNYVSYTDFICLFIVCLSSLLHLLKVSILDIVILTTSLLTALSTIEAGISKAQAKAAVDAAIKVMTTALVKGDKIALVGFGTLAVQEKAERKGVNPSTGAPITIPAKKVVKFKPSAELAEKVKQ